MSTEIMLVLAILSLGLVFLGEKTKVGIYFLAAIIPTLLLSWQLQDPLFYAFGLLLSIFLVWRTFNNSGNGA